MSGRSQARWHCCFRSSRISYNTIAPFDLRRAFVLTLRVLAMLRVLLYTIRAEIVVLLPFPTLHSDPASSLMNLWSLRPLNPSSDAARCRRLYSQLLASRDAASAQQTIIVQTCACSSLPLANRLGGAAGRAAKVEASTHRRNWLRTCKGLYSVPIPSLARRATSACGTFSFRTFFFRRVRLSVSSCLFSSCITTIVLFPVVHTQ